MGIHGTILNGQVQWDKPVNLPEGTRVMLWRDLDALEYPHPMASYDEEKELALLRESIRDMEAGLGQPFDKAMDDILIDFKAQRQS